MEPDIYEWLRERQTITSPSGITYDVRRFKEAADEIERLRAELADCNNDFDCLKQIHDKVRSERDQLLEGFLNNVHLS